MGVPLPGPEPSLSGQPAAMDMLAGARASRDASRNNSLAADETMRSLSSLLLAARAAAVPHTHSVPGSSGLDPPSLRLAAPARQAPLPAPQPSAFRSLALMRSQLSPPPLAPATDSEDSDVDWDLPRLVSESPPSRRAIDDLFCPWGPDGSGDQPMRDAPPQPQRTIVLRPSALRSMPFGSARASSEALRAVAGMRTQRRSAPASSASAATFSLEEELGGLASKVAQLMHQHQQQLIAAEPHIRAGLQEVANQLEALANQLDAGPPPLA